MKGFAIFLSGAVLGAAGSALYFALRVAPEMRKTAVDEAMKIAEEEVKKELHDYAPDASETDEHTVVKEDPSELKRKVREALKTDYLDYTKFSGEVAVEEKDISEAKGSESTERGGEVPYVIDEGDFDEYSGYTCLTFEVYSDGVFIDAASEEELDADPELVFGRDALDELEKSISGIVCVRDDSKKCTYRLERKDYPANGPDDILPPGPEIDWGP